MAKAKKMPSGRYRTLVYSHTEKAEDPSTGKILDKRRYESFVGDTAAESELMAAQFKFDRKKQRKTSGLTLGDAIEQYIDNSSNILSPTTVQSYRKIRKNAFSMLMDMPINKITNESLKIAVNQEASRPSGKSKTNPKPISPKYLKDEYGLISSVLHTYAPNLDTRVKLPSKITKIKELLPPERIFDLIADESVEFKLAVTLSMWLSFSRSEIRGLKQSSIVGDYIKIDQVVVDVGNEVVEKKQAKVFTRIRKHKIPQYISDLISQLPPEQEYLVTLTGTQLYKRWVKLLKSQNLPHMTFHDLRHVNASVMALLQIPDKYAQERGGWKTDSTMKAVYTHTFSEARKEVDQRIDDFFEDKLLSKKKSDSFSIAGEEFTEIEYRKIIEYALFIKSSRT